jgi:hypothetical protein
LVETPETTESISSEFAPCASGEDVAGGNHQQRDFLAEALGNGDSLGKDHLLVFAEALFLGAEILRSAHAHHAHADDHHVLLFGAGAGERPLEREGVGGVAHGDHDAAGADGRRLAADGVLVLQLEVVLHLPRGDGMLAQVLRSEM